MLLVEARPDRGIESIEARRLTIAATQKYLSGSSQPLSQQYDVALLDLDGVVYVGPEAVPGAGAALGDARAAGMRLAFVTNNAARTPEVVAQHLTSLGVAAEPADVTTSSLAAAHYLADRLDPGSKVLVVGTDGLVQALHERGLVPVFSADDEPAAVVQGYSPTLDWRQLSEGAIAIRRGLLWVATNLDATVPSPRGPLPGNGSLVAALERATDSEPISTGKPDPTMHRESVERSGAQHPIVVGDRLDTDIEGARRADCASLLVLSGVTDSARLVDAPSGQRPDYVSRDVGGLLHSHPEVSTTHSGWSCAGWHVGQDLKLTGAQEGRETDGLDALRVICAAAWTVRDLHADTSARVTPGDEAAKQALAALGL